MDIICHIWYNKNMKMFENKRCPRCDYKMPKETAVCPSCRLNFEKFNSATNAQAKEALSQGETDRVILRKGVPNDVNRLKLIIITIFLGFMGAHYYYVGRKKMGLFFTLFFVVGLINAALQYFVIPRTDLTEIIAFASLIWGIVLFLWIIDIFKVALNLFKVPVSRE